MTEPQVVSIDNYVSEGSLCPQCRVGLLEYIRQEPCSCHINPPCSACVDAPLACPKCHFAIEQDKPTPVDYGHCIPLRFYDKAKRSSDLGDGKRIFDYSYKSDSGSTMEYEGRYEGPVTCADIIQFFGDGTFGHRGPSMLHGRFTYTKVTD